MALQCPLSCRLSTSVLMEERKSQAPVSMSSSGPSGQKLGDVWILIQELGFRWQLKKTDGDDSEESHGSSAKTKGKSKNFSKDKDEPFLMTDDERWEFRKKIKEVMGMSPVVEEAIDPVERQKKVEKLFADYPLVVDEEDPRWF